MRDACDYDAAFDEDAVRIARRSYYALVSFLDSNIGHILSALEQAGLRETTRVIYTSDHGENLGNRGLWGKSVMYDDAAAVPLLVSGPEIPQGLHVDTPVSLVDLHPTLLQSAELSSGADDLPGEALFSRFDAPEEDRTVFSEYHDWSSITGMFMARSRRWKLVRYPGYDDQLFDMQNDPFEMRDLASDPGHAGTREEMRRKLSEILDVDAVNARAFAEQRAKIASLGGRAAILAAQEQAYTPAPEA